jgi:hypothetical protein
MTRKEIQNKVDYPAALWQGSLSIDRNSYERLPVYHLLSTNTKLAKGLEFGYLNLGLQLAPAKTSGYQTCPMSTAGCRAACIFVSGFARIFAKINEARIRKTKLYFENRPEFMRLLELDITKAQEQAVKLGKELVIRLNVFSDIPWEESGIMEKFPTVRFMDYTAIAKRFFKKLPANYHLTFSRKETAQNHKDCERVLQAGGNVAVVFRGGLPDTFMGKPVIDGDLSDLRLFDPKNVIVGLKDKGEGKKDTSGFIVDVVNSKAVAA